ncbi:hypothetical protein J3R83DRAFT_5220 [Lanmaoa asiatica]|nr:hypothetical protein J3R83DRAFT_5220 [Lanmaoa asiatica]
MIHSFRGQVQNAPPNPSTLPTLTVAFEVAVSQTASKSSFDTLVLRSPASVQELRRDSISVLLERELTLTSDTLSLSLSFTHSTMLWTPMTSGWPEQHCTVTNPTFRIEYITTRIVRVLPPVSVRPRITNGSLPTELLIKTFEDVEFRDSWHDDLLSFAQVCRAWSCAMDVLHSRLSFSDDDKWSHPRHALDVYALAKALSEKPLLGQSFRRFTTNNFGKSEDLHDVFNFPSRKNPARYTAALIAILRTTKNLQCVHLGQLDPCQRGALFTVLRELRDVRTLSIGRVEERLIGGFLKHHRIDGATRMLSVIQLARCMRRWPVLKSLKIYHLHPGIIGIWRFALRPPACMLTQLTIGRSRVGDKDLVHLFASSAKTLERVVLDRIEGVTNAGLCAFLLGISENVVHLTIQDVALPPFRQWGNLVIGRTERALDVVVEKMSRLRELRISGDVASEFMLDRRSKIFVAHDTPEETRVPVVRLWLEDVPRLCGFAADGKWPGWCTPGKAPRR